MVERADFETTVGGIPCGVVIDYYESVQGNSSADNPWDYHGYTECEWHLVDRKGYKAEWLASKMTPQDSRRITQEIDEHIAHRSRDLCEP